VKIHDVEILYGWVMAFLGINMKWVSYITVILPANPVISRL